MLPRALKEEVTTQVGTKERNKSFARMYLYDLCSANGVLLSCHQDTVCGSSGTVAKKWVLIFNANVPILITQRDRIVFAESAHSQMAFYKYVLYFRKICLRQLK